MTCRRNWSVSRWAGGIVARPSDGSRCASLVRTTRSGWMPIPIRNSTRGGGRSLPSCLRWRWISSARSTRYLSRRSGGLPTGSTCERPAPAPRPPTTARERARGLTIPCVTPSCGGAIGGRPMGSTIDLTASDGFKLAAYTGGPAGAAKGIVVIQEIFGVNHHIRDMCERFAAQGYAVCAPALFDRTERGVELGYTQADIDAGRAYRMKLNDAQVILDVEAAAARLAGKKLAIVGYCFGGTVAWWGATRTTKLAASSCWYGGGIAGTKDERPHCPVQMHFGEKDASIPMTDVDAIQIGRAHV